nr:hypothetical protein [Herbidospora mongoliensis]
MASTHTTAGSFVDAASRGLVAEIAGRPVDDDAVRVGNWRGVVKAGRASQTVTSKPRNDPVRARAAAKSTAPKMIRRAAARRR